MRYRLTESLGLSDARQCNVRCGAGLPVDVAALKKGAVVELPEAAADFLTKKFPALLVAIAPDPPIRAVPPKPREEKPKVKEAEE